MLVAGKRRLKVSPLVGEDLFDKAWLFLVDIVNRLKETSGVRPQVADVIGFDHNENQRALASGLLLSLVLSLVLSRSASSL